MTATQSNFWGELIRQLREEQGISQRELCRATGVNRSTLRRIQEGRAMCAVETLETIFDYLNHDLEAIDRGQRRLPETDHNRRSKVAAALLLKLTAKNLR